MDCLKTNFLATLDTNIILSSQKGSANSPNVEILTRWKRGEFEVLYSQEVLEEYIEKLEAFNVPELKVKRIIHAFLKQAKFVNIDFHYLKKYPDDPDDTAFLLCAHNGDATHLVSYDRHLLDINKYFDFLICEPVPFLKELRQELHGK